MKQKRGTKTRKLSKTVLRAEVIAGFGFDASGNRVRLDDKPMARDLKGGYKLR